MKAIQPASDDDLCERCGHPFGPHILFTDKSPPTNGFIGCQEDDCDCMGTWSVSDDLAARLTEIIQEDPDETPPTTTAL